MASDIVENTDTINSGVTDGDDIFFAEGATDVTVNIDKSGLGANGLGKVFLAHPWVANVGTFGAPFKAEISADSDSIFDNKAGRGTFYYEINGNANVCDLVRSSGPGTRLTVLQTGGTATVVECASGIIDVSEPVAATTLRLSGNGLINMPDAASTDPTLVELTGGSWVTERGATTVDNWGGMVDANVGANTFGTINQRGGSFMLRQSGTITALNWSGGNFDITKLGRNVIITTLTVWAGVNQNALHDLIHSPLTVITNPIVYRMGNA
ncbi:MAG: hypothetical protein IID39_05150 [Planctomycetes bacterium]|nr:hypothetical protein [Planctomycetota bacterium]